MPGPIAALMNELPKKGGSWTEDEHDRFVKTFKALLEFSFEVKEEEPDKDKEDEGGVMS